MGSHVSGEHNGIYLLSTVWPERGVIVRWPTRPRGNPIFRRNSYREARPAIKLRLYCPTQ